MKILFAVSNENISNAIVKNYQNKYNDAVTFKNVFYFNAITKELQKDKSYDVIVISEDLEPFSNSNYDVIDKFILGRLESISVVVNDIEEKEIPIVLICTDRRTKSGEVVSKFFDMKIYNALIGSDRKIDEVCKLIVNSRTKEEARKYYNLNSNESEDIGMDDVSELEVQNILIHYKRLGGNEEKYIESFNNIASQYTDNQLRIIIRYLPIKVKAVLEAECPKYQELVMNSNHLESEKEQRVKEKEKEKRLRDKYEQEQLLREKIYKENKQKENRKKDDYVVGKNPDGSKVSLDILENKIKDQKLSSPVIIPDSINTRNERKLYTDEEIEEKENRNIKPTVKEEILEETPQALKNDKDIIDSTQEGLQVEKMPKKKGRGRPRKNPISTELKPKGKRGRPRKNPLPDEQDEKDIQNQSDNNSSAVLPGFNDVEDDDFSVEPIKEESKANSTSKVLPGFDDIEEGNYDVESIKDESNFDSTDGALPGFDDIEDDDFDVESIKDESEFNSESGVLPGFDDIEDDDSVSDILPGIEDELVTENKFINNTNRINQYENTKKTEEIKKIEENKVYSTGSLSSVLTSDKKIAAFVGTSKNGTSFLVNNLACLFSSIGINTAILDVTQNRNSYYIFTDNNEELRKIAYTSIGKLENGVAEGIKVDRNLTVYTSVPNEEQDTLNSEAILSTLARNHTLVLIDCDYDTDYGYFANSQEIYLVQSMDVLTIQPLTTFLRELKTRGILDPQKLRAVINKEVKVRGVNSKTIIGGMSSYNDPAMSFMTELFNKDKIRACTIPFDVSVYSKYLETLITCKVTISGYSKNFINSLKILGNMIYPLMSKQTYLKSMPDYSKSNFSDEMNDTLSRMRKKY